MAKEAIYEKAKDSIIEADEDMAMEALEEAEAEGLDLVELLTEGYSAGMKELGPIRHGRDLPSRAYFCN